ncbi:MAG TPA: GTP-binding protein, partial [Candidatus Coprosoma intestinipullorum]|nr:GTP-binding protein [Candidatus Coprosoma intestinipullorum]
EYEDTPVMTNNKVKNSLNSLEKKINNILEKSNEGEIIKNGIKTVIAGKPNVGKSSLLNRLLGEDRAIVTDVQGTTRDSIEASLVIDNIVLNLIDTAGIRDTSDTVESIGVSKSLSLIDQADLVLFVLNYNEEMTADERMILEKIRDKNHIIIVNKTDLEKKLDTSELDNPIYISIKDDKNIDEIKDRIKELFNLEKIETGDLTYLTSARSKAILRQVLDSVSDVREGIDNYPIDIVEIDLKKIWNLLGDIIGENYSEELLDELFSRFCVGK